MGTSKKKLMIIAAHPDDEVLGAYSYLSNKSYECQTIFVCEGSSARFLFGEKSQALDQAVKLREIAALNVSKELKNLPPIFLNYTNLTLASLPVIEINQKIEPLIDSFRPNLIMTHTQDCNNLDHRMVSTCVSSIVRANKFPNIEMILNMEIPSSTEQFWNHSFTPNHFITLSKSQMDKKIEMLSIYGDELQSDPDPRSSFGVRSYAQFRGLACGAMYAESFKIVRSIFRGEVSNGK